MSSIGQLIIGLGANTDGLKKGMADAVSVVKDGARKMGDEADKAGNKVSEGVGKSDKAVESLRKQFRQASQDAQKLAQSTGYMSAEFIEAAREAGRLKDEINDINEVIEAFAGESVFKSATASVAGLVGVVGAAEGAMALLGVQSEATQQVMMKLQAIETIIHSLMAVQGAVNAFQAFATVLKVQVIPSIMTLNGSMMASGIGLLVAGLAVAIAAWSDYKQSNEELINLEARLQERLKQTTSALLEELDAVEELVKARRGGANAQERELKIAEAAGESAERLSQRREKLLVAERARLLVRKRIMVEEGVTDQALLQVREAIKDKEAEIIAERTKRARMAHDEEIKLTRARWDAQKEFEQQEDAQAKKAAERAREVEAARLESREMGIRAIKDDFDRRIEEINFAQEKEITAEKEKYAKGLVNRKQYYEDLAAIDAFYQGQRDAELDKIYKRPQEEAITAPERTNAPALTGAAAMPLTEQNKHLQEQSQHLQAVKRDIDAVTLGWENQGKKLETVIPLNQLAAQSITYLAEQMGAALAGASVSLSSILDGLMGMMTDFMKGLGESMIATGVAGLAAKALFANPAAAIAAGTALVVLASAMNSLLKDGPGGSSGGGSGTAGGPTRVNTGGQIKLAKGGLAFGPTSAIVGDNPNAWRDPEVISPLSKLHNFIPSAEPVVLGGVLHGSDIYLTQRTSRQKSIRRGA